MEETPFEDRTVPKAEIDWDRSCWWWYPLTRVVQPAIRITTVVYSLLSVWLLWLGIQIAQWAFRPSWNREAFEWLSDNFTSMRGTGFRPFIVEWASFAFEALTDFEAFGLPEFAFVLFVFVWCSVLAGLLGGIIARRAAFELGQRTVATWFDSFGFMAKRWQSCFWNVGMHLVAALALLTPIALLGWIARLGTPGVIVASIGIIVLFPAIIATGRMILSATICYPLAICAIAVEKKGDAFEGFSRSNAYVFQRPVIAFVCAALLLLVGVVGELVVYWTLHFGWKIGSGVLQLTGGDAVNEVMALGDWCVSSLVAAYWFGYLWSAAAALYLVLRKSVDNCELDEMDLAESDTERTLPDIPTTSQVANQPTTNVDSVSSSASESSENSPPTEPKDPT